MGQEPIGIHEEGCICDPYDGKNTDRDVHKTFHAILTPTYPRQTVIGILSTIPRILSLDRNRGRNSVGSAMHSTG